jgi:hypothetical protein
MVFLILLSLLSPPNISEIKNIQHSITMNFYFFKLRGIQVEMKAKSFQDALEKARSWMKLTDVSI